MAGTVLVVGSGGREHALGRRLAACEGVQRVVICPGNAGTGEGVERHAGDPLAAATELQPDLVVIGPEVPLTEGLSDRLRAAGFSVFGPSAAAAELEGSKAYMKAFCERHAIRTARYVRVEQLADLDAALASFQTPPVVKASGLCAGKGVVVADTFEQARSAAEEMLSGEAFGDAGRVVVLEERLLGEEVSIHAVCDGSQWLTLPAVQDHKRIGDGDSGPNTGGMGTYGPAPVVSPRVAERIEEEILAKIVAGMASEGRPFVGVIFAGLMISPEGEPALIEINVRFGDPETQVLVNLIEGDFYGLLASAAQGRLDATRVATGSERAAMCVVMAAAGYPATPRSGDPITGIEQAEHVEGVSVYHAGTRRDGDRVVASGGRVLGVTAVGRTLKEARERAYQGCSRIGFEGAQYRRDIGYRALARS
jgi:phosphoribosylamine---glycine ligase